MARVLLECPQSQLPPVQTVKRQQPSIDALAFFNSLQCYFNAIPMSRKELLTKATNSFPALFHEICVSAARIHLDRRLLLRVAIIIFSRFGLISTGSHILHRVIGCIVQGKLRVTH